MPEVLVVKNEYGQVLGEIDGGVLQLRVEAETPQHGYFKQEIKLSSPLKLIHLYATLLYFESAADSLFFQVHQTSIVNAMEEKLRAYKDSGRLLEPEVHDLARTLKLAMRSEEDQLPVGVPLFEGELCNYKTMSSDGNNVGLRIYTAYSHKFKRNRILLMMKKLGDERRARFDLNAGQMLAAKELAEEAVRSYDKLSVTMLEGSTLHVIVEASRNGLCFVIHTPYVDRVLEFYQGDNLGSLAFWSRRALTFRGNWSLRFGDNRAGISFATRDEDVPRPFLRFYIDDKREILNLTRLNLTCLELFSRFILKKRGLSEKKVMQVDTFTPRVLAN